MKAILKALHIVITQAVASIVNQTKKIKKYSTDLNNRNLTTQNKYYLNQLLRVLLKSSLR